MIEINVNIRINLLEINTYLFNFKNKEQFEKEFNFRSG